MPGYISLHRDIQKHWLYEEDRVFSRYEAWLDILMRVNHTEGKVLHNGKVEMVDRGSTIWSMGDMEHHWKWSNRKVKRFLDCLVVDQMLTYKSTTKKTYLTVVNYGKYQGDDEEEAPPKHHRSTAEAFQKHTNNNVNNENNENNVKEEHKNIFSFWNSLSIVKHRELTKKMKSAINARLATRTEREITEAMQNYQTILNGDIYWWTYKFTLDKFMDPKNLDQFISDNNPFENFIKSKGGGNGGKYQASYAGVSEASRKNASRGAEHFIGSPGRESGLTTEEVQRLASNFD